MQGLPAYFSAARILLKLLRSGEEPIPCKTEDGTWPGPDGNPTPYRKFSPQRSNHEWLLLYPGASPYGEQHPAMNQLSRAAAVSGYTVVIPRIPSLMALEVKPEVHEWIQHFYRWFRSRLPTGTKAVRIMGASFGGPLLLRCLQDGPLKENPPESFLMYGPYFDFNSILDYLCTGELTYEGKTWVQPVHEWGLVVIFHNYLKLIDPGYSVEGLKQVLKIRVKDNEEGSNAALEKLTGKERELGDALLTGKATEEVKRLVKLIKTANAETFRELSPSTYADRTPIKVHIIHGRTDTMVPFTESIKLAEALPDSELLLTGLYEHSEMTDGGLLSKIREAWKVLLFLKSYLSSGK